MQNLILARDVDECAIGLNMADCIGLKCVSLLGLKDEAPYFMNITFNDERVICWEDAGVNSIAIQFSSTKNFKQHLNMFLCALRADPELKEFESFLMSPYVNTRLVMDLCTRYVCVIETMHRFFAAARPEKVYISPRTSFSGQLVNAIAAAYGIPILSIAQ
ncbi:MAG: hypothetical protein HQL45_12910 [Alphaproteobacteria bacterium]|nr:hypothetical protein [Alphaproteobacteria bacterium]